VVDYIGEISSENYGNLIFLMILNYKCTIMRKILLIFFVLFGMLLEVNAQQRTITGTVSSSVPGEGNMPGVSVSVKGTTVGI
jgi:hypothetical protein